MRFCLHRFSGVALDPVKLEDRLTLSDFPRTIVSTGQALCPRRGLRGFQFTASVRSSLTCPDKTPWAGEKVEVWIMPEKAVAENGYT